MTDYTRFKDSLPFPKNLNNSKVKVMYSTGKTEIKSFNEVSKFAVSHKDLNFCANLAKNGWIRQGSVEFTLIER